MGWITMLHHKGSAAAMERAWAPSKRLSRMTGFRFTAFCIAAGILGFIVDVAVLWLVRLAPAITLSLRK